MNWFATIKTNKPALVRIWLPGYLKFLKCYGFRSECVFKSSYYVWGLSYELRNCIGTSDGENKCFDCNALHHLRETLDSDSCVPDSLRINSPEYTITSVSLFLAIPLAVCGVRVCHHWLATIPNHFLLGLSWIQKRQCTNLRLYSCCSACSSAHQIAVLPFRGASTTWRNGLPESHEVQ